ncbi:MAG: hypothetical protein NTNFB02_37900 [Nitrospira sp.]
MPLASVAGAEMVGCGTALIEMVRVFCATCWVGVEESTTWNFGVTVWIVVGVPLMTPAGLRLRPLGNEGDPLTRLHE